MIKASIVVCIEWI